MIFTAYCSSESFCDWLIGHFMNGLKSFWSYCSHLLYLKMFRVPLKTCSDVISVCNKLIMTCKFNKDDFPHPAASNDCKWSPYKYYKRSKTFFICISMLVCWDICWRSLYFLCESAHNIFFVMFFLACFFVNSYVWLEWPHHVLTIISRSEACIDMSFDVGVVWFFLNEYLFLCFFA